MKIIHTSDWHLGHRLYEYERLDEHRDLLIQLAQIVSAEQPDALVVSGDIYHTSNPSNQYQRLFNEYLIRIQEAAPQMQIVVSSGNHDSGLKLEVARELWNKFGISIVGQFHYQDNVVSLDKHIVEVRPDGELKGYIVAIPFAHPCNFPKVAEVSDSEEDKQSSFIRAVLKEVSRRNPFGLPVVLMAHLFVQGTEPNKHDSIGGLDYVHLSSLGTDFDYLALGHIHKPYTIHSECPQQARYCGSPIAVSFDEDFDHTVSLVTFEGRRAHIDTIPIQARIPLKTLPVQALPFDEALAHARQYLRQHPEQEIYLRLNTSNTIDTLPPTAKEQSSQVFKDTLARFCYIKTQQSEENKEHKERNKLSIQELQVYNPLVLAKEYYLRRYNQEMPEELISCLQEAILQHNEKE